MKADVRDVGAGIAISLFGLVFFVKSFEYGLGSALRMGPGFFPMLIGGMTAIVGLIIAVPAFGRSHGMPPVAWRPLTAVLGSIAAFGIGLVYLGLVPSVFLCVCICSIADQSVRPISTLVLGAAAALLCWLIFTEGLALQIPAFGGV